MAQISRSSGLITKLCNYERIELNIAKKSPKYCLNFYVRKISVPNQRKMSSNCKISASSRWILILWLCISQQEEQIAMPNQQSSFTSINKPDLNIIDVNFVPELNQFSWRINTSYLFTKLPLIKDIIVEFGYDERAKKWKFTSTSSDDFKIFSAWSKMWTTRVKLIMGHSSRPYKQFLFLFWNTINLVPLLFLQIAI